MQREIYFIVPILCYQRAHFFVFLFHLMIHETISVRNMFLARRPRRAC